MFGLGFRLCPAISGWGSWCARLGLGSAVTPPLLAGVYGVCAWIRVLAALRHSWLGFVVCVCGFGFLLHPAFSGWGVGACGLLRAPRPCPATPWWGCLWRGVVRGSPWAAHVPPVPSIDIEHWKRDQYCPVTGGNFGKSVPTCMRYASVRRLEVFENPRKDAQKFWQPDGVPKRNRYR